MPMDPTQAETMRRALAEYDGTAPAATGWGQARPSAGPISGVNVPIKVQTPDGGSIRIYLTLAAEVIQSQASLFAALSALAAQGMTLDVYMPKPAWGGNGGGYRGNGGGWGGGRRW